VAPFLTACSTGIAKGDCVGAVVSLGKKTLGDKDTSDGCKQSNNNVDDGPSHTSSNDSTFPSAGLSS
jgi:hypothetical protein